MKLPSILPRLAFIAALFVFISSCSENLDSSGVCDVLCPEIGGDVKTDIIDAVTLDTTVQSVSGLGTEPALLLANRGDTLDTRVVIRFDSLPKKFIPQGDTSQDIKSVDSAYILMRLDTLSIKGSDAVTIEAYDVDTTANDTSTADVLALFRPDRFISSQTYARSELTDSLKYFISNDTVLAKIQNGERLRIGLRATGVSSSQLTLASTEGGIPPILFFRATPDTATKPLTVTPFSATPANESLVAQHLTDYTIIAKAPPNAPPNVLAVGGMPPRRVYAKFDIPSKYIDSSTVVRATLLLNQISNLSLDPGDTIRVVPQVVLAGKVVTDPSKAAQIIANISADTLRITAGHGGSVDVELAAAFALWRTQQPDTLPRAIVLKSAFEGVSPIELRFSSSEDIAALRPRLRISYTTRVPLGLP
ncbi:MAG: hypothetical protein AUG20_04395 [Gemmatimonas sp. 13_1_20CM_3_60_15]|nr:MAG: hypothetical protein AUG20_04395 [Gemmatimonas sp. 13_1_20CM_3_60_15]